MSFRTALLNRVIERRPRFTAATAAVLMAALFSVAIASVRAQGAGSVYRARLSPVPIDLSMMARIAGSGSLTATLSGNRLAIEGTFEGLRSPATTAQIHRATKGIPGPVVPNLDLTVTGADKGTIRGTLELTPDEVADLRSERLYVQIQSEGAPEGNLWGWLLPEANAKR